MTGKRCYDNTYLISSNKHSSSNKWPPSNKHPTPRPLYQIRAPLPHDSVPPPFPLTFLKKSSRDTRKTSFYGHLIFNFLGFNYNHWISVAKWFQHTGISLSQIKLFLYLYACLQSSFLCIISSFNFCCIAHSLGKCCKLPVNN